MEILLIILGIFLLMIIIISVYEHSHYEIDMQPVLDNRVKEKLRLLFFADMHNNSYGKNNAKLLEDIDIFNPDVIVISGDLFVSKKHEKNEQALNLIRKLTEKYKVVFTYGNHESKLKNSEKYKYSMEVMKEFEGNGNLYLLNNKGARLRLGNNVMDFFGYEADLKHYKKSKKSCPDMSEIMEVFKDKKPCEEVISVLLAHNPNFFDLYAQTGVDYVFSGHNHGGIVRLPYMGGIMSTGLKLFPKYDSGEYVKGKTKMFVTRGLGSHSIKLRIFNRPQIHAYTFMSS